jgi:hypothetical protein
MESYELKLYKCPKCKRYFNSADETIDVGTLTAILLVKAKKATCGRCKND